MTLEESRSLGRAVFAQSFSTEPDGVWQAPGRVNIIGEHTDYQLGYCLPMAIGARTVVAARRRADGVVRAYSKNLEAWAEGEIAHLEPGPRGQWFNYVLGMVAETGCPGGVDLAIGGDLPLGAGVSSSAALEMAVGHALNDLFGLGLTATGLALAGQRAEHRFAGVATGILDQFASALGQPRCALFLDTRQRHATPVPFQPEEAGLALALVDTRAERRLVGGGYQVRVDEAERAAAALGVSHLRDADPAAVEELEDPILRGRARHIVSENRRVLAVVEASSRGEWSVVGEALYASHRSLALDYEVSHPALDRVVEVARSTEGVFGARMTGGGFGGSAIVLLETLAEQDLRAGLARAWAEAGWEPPRCMLVHASAGAGRADGGAGAC